MKKVYVDVINTLFENSYKAYIDCDRCTLFWGSDDENVRDEFFTLELLSNDLAKYVFSANRKNTLIIEDIKDDAIATLEKISIFDYPEIVGWIAEFGQAAESYNSMVYLQSLESLRTAIITFLKLTEVNTSTKSSQIVTRINREVIILKRPLQ